MALFLSDFSFRNENLELFDHTLAFLCSNCKYKFWTTCDGWKVLELYPVKLLKEIELACTFPNSAYIFWFVLQKRGCCLEKNPVRGAQCLSVNSCYIWPHCDPPLLLSYSVGTLVELHANWCFEFYQLITSGLIT